jgi:PAS domain S-box-containing protein
MEASFASIVDGALDSIISTDLHGRVLSWNRSAERLFGWTAQEMIGASVLRIVPDDMQDEENLILDQVRAGQLVRKFETVRRHKDERLMPVALTISPLRNDDGDVIGASKIAHDISEMVAMRRKLAESEKLLRTFADIVPQLLWSADAKGHVTWVNDRWAHFTGASAEESLRSGWMKFLHPDHVTRVKAAWAAAAEHGEEWEETFPLRGADGRYRWFLSSARPLKDASGKAAQWFGANADITEKIEHDEQVQVLMGEVHHRAKNMIAVVQGVVQRTIDREQAERLVSRLHALGRNLDLLTTRNWTGAPVGELIRSQLVSVGDLIGERVFVEGSGLDEVIGRVAAEALGLTIHELATNATKYGALSNEAGKIVIRGEVERDGAEPTLVIEWLESGGPAVRAPTRKGFGSTMIDRNPRYAMSATVEYDYPETGFFWRLKAPLAKVAPTEALV